jgi:Family of unknown function (DUF6518)
MDEAAAVGLPRRVRSWWRATLLAVGVGIAIGALTLVGQRSMPGQWNTLVNSGAVWLVPVFFVGWRMPSLRLAAVLGAATLLATLIGYYVPSALSGTPHSPYFVALWTATAIVAGPLLGVAGYGWRGDRRALRIVGVALLGGVLAAEGLFIIIVLGYEWSGWTMAAAGVTAVVVLASRRDRLVTLVALPVPIVAAGTAYAVINWLATNPSL